MGIEKGIGTAKQKKIVDHIVDFWETGKKARYEKEEKWHENVTHYMTYVDTAKFANWEWRSKVARPVSQEIADSIKSAVKTAMFPDNEDFFEVQGLDPIGKNFAHIIKKRMQKVLFDMRFGSSFSSFLVQLCVVGASHGQIAWKEESAYRRRWQNGQVVGKPTITYDGPRFENHDIFNVLLDPRATHYEQQTPRVIRLVVDQSFIKMNTDIYDNTAKLLKSSTGAPKESSDSRREERRRIFGWQEGLINKDGDVELLIYTGDLAIDSEIHADKIFVVGNREVLMQAEMIEYFCGYPWIFSSYTDVPQEILGRGPLEPIRGIQKLIDTFTNQKADYANLTMGGMFAINGNVDPSNLIMRPYGFVECEDVNKDIKPLAPTGNPTLAFAEINDLKAEAEQSTAASKARQGMFMPGRRTATESLQVNAGGTTRFTDVTTHIGEMAVEPALNMIMAMDFQFNYGNPELLPPLAWEGSYRIHFYGAKATALREIEIQHLSVFTDLMTRNPVFAQFLNPPELANEWMKKLQLKNDKLIRQTPLSQDFPQLTDGNNGQGGSLPGVSGDRFSIGAGRSG